MFANTKYSGIANGPDFTPNRSSTQAANAAMYTPAWAANKIEKTKELNPNIADEISIALICTAMGLATAIPFNFFLASINNRLRKLQDSLAAGLARILEFFKQQQ